MEAIKFVDLHSQYLAYKSEIDAEVLKVLASQQYIGGPQLAALEQELQEFCLARSGAGAPQKAAAAQATETAKSDGADGESGAAQQAKQLRAVGCSNGTDAILLALLAAGVKPGDEVITPSFTFVSTVEVVCLIGAIPVFADIDLATGLMDAQVLENKITAKTKAIIPVSLFGQVPQMTEINNLAAKHSLTVIEDAAQSFGALYRGGISCGLSRYACTSFYPAKGLGCYGDGGAVFANNSDDEKQLRSLLNHGQDQRYEYVAIGINGRLDDIQAAVLRVKLRHYGAELAKRQDLAAGYDRALAGHPALTPLSLLPGNESVYSQYSLYAPAGKRDDYRKILQQQGIPTAVYYPKPLHQHKVFEEYLLAAGRELPRDLPKTEAAAARIFSLPVHPFLLPEQQEKIIDALGKLD